MEIKHDKKLVAIGCRIRGVWSFSVSDDIKNGLVRRYRPIESSKRAATGGGPGTQREKARLTGKGARLFKIV